MRGREGEGEGVGGGRGDGGGVGGGVKGEVQFGERSVDHQRFYHDITGEGGGGSEGVDKSGG